MILCSLIHARAPQQGQHLRPHDEGNVEHRIRIAIKRYVGHSQKWFNVVLRTGNPSL